MKAAASLWSELRRRNVVRVAVLYVVSGWLLLQVGDVLFDLIGVPSWALRLLAGILLLGLPAVLIFSWVYEITPEGIRREREVARDASITHLTARRLDLAVLAAVGALIALHLFQTRSPEAGVAAPPRSTPAVDAALNSLAVLPFEDISEQADQAHLARGVAETLLHMLAQVPDLRVVARTSSFKYADQSLPVVDIAKELSVAAVLEGSVQRSGDRLRIIAQLIDGTDGAYLWSETFDRPMGDVFAIQDEIAQAVVQVVRPVGSDSPPAILSSRTEPAAYEHFLRGRELRRQLSSESLPRALEELEAALALDPDFVPALVELGYTWGYLPGFSNATWAEVREHARVAFERAYELAPNDATVLLAQAELALYEGGPDSLSRGLELLERVVEAKPNDADALSLLAREHKLQGEIQTAVELSRRAAQLDPRNPYVLTRYGELMADVGEFEEARRTAETLLGLSDSEPAGAWSMIESIGHEQRRYDLAIPPLVRAIEADPRNYDPWIHIADLYAEIDDQERAELWYQRMPKDLRDPTVVPDAMFYTPDRIEELVTITRQRAERWGNASVNSHLRALLAAGRRDELLETLADLEEDPFRWHTSLILAAEIGLAAKSWGSEQIGQALLDRARERREKLRGTSYHPYSQRQMDVIFALADGDIERALDRWEVFVAHGGICIRFCKMTPVYDAIRDHPRFRAAWGRMLDNVERQAQALREAGL